MKNKIYYLGIATLVLVSAGCIFKIMHWPGAGIGITLGVLMLSFAFIPAAFISSFRSEENKSHKKLYFLFALVIIIDLIGALFKVMHWPGAGILIIVTMPLPFILILPAYLISNRKENEINYKNFLAIVFFFAYFAAISALLAIGVQKEVLDGYIRSAMNIEQKTDVLSFQCQVMQKNLNGYNLTDPGKINKIQKTRMFADNICRKIDSIVIYLIIRQPDYTPDMDLKNGRPDLWKIKYKDAAVGDWIVNDLFTLKSDIVAYKKMLATPVTGEINSSSQFETLLNTNESNGLSWEYKLIKDKIIVSGIAQLYLLKHQIRLTEWDVLVGLKQ